MKRYALIILITVLAFSSLACSITVNAPDLRAKTGPTQTLDVNEAAPSGPAKLAISMGAGKLDISGGGTALVSGTVRYNVEQIKPTINRSGDEISIKQNTDRVGSIGPDVINDWTFKLGKTPLDLTINAGAYEGTVDLTGVPLTNLKFNDGASKSHVIFRDTNPETMKTLSYKTGASNVDMEGLGYANFEEMTFGGGAGAYTLDFGGKLQQDASVNITSGVSSVKIIVPTGTRCVVKISGGLNNVDPSGTWTVNGKEYSTSGEGHLLTISVDMGVGNLELISQ